MSSQLSAESLQGGIIYTANSHEGLDHQQMSQNRQGGIIYPATSQEGFHHQLTGQTLQGSVIYPEDSQEGFSHQLTRNTQQGGMIHIPSVDPTNPKFHSRLRELEQTIALVHLKFQRVCRQIHLLNNHFQDSELRFLRSQRSHDHTGSSVYKGACSYNQRIKLCVVDGVRSMYHEYALRTAEKLDTLKLYWHHMQHLLQGGLVHYGQDGGMVHYGEGRGILHYVEEEMEESLSDTTDEDSMLSEDETDENDNEETTGESGHRESSDVTGGISGHVTEVISGHVTEVNNGHVTEVVSGYVIEDLSDNNVTEEIVEKSHVTERDIISGHLLKNSDHVTKRDSAYVREDVVHGPQKSAGNGDITVTI